MSWWQDPTVVGVVAIVPLVLNLIAAAFTSLRDSERRGR